MSDLKRQDASGWRPQTRLIRGGTTRTSHGETSEALFLTSGYRYDRTEIHDCKSVGLLRSSGLLESEQGAVATARGVASTTP